MTDAAPFPEPAVDRWLSEQRKTVDHGIAQFLDVDGGLREVMIHARHANLVEELNHRFDVEAGLAAILPAAAGARATDPLDTPMAPATDRAELRMRMAAVPPKTRLAVRNHPVVTLSILAELRSRSCELAIDPLLARDHLVRDLDRARASALDLDLDFHCDRVRGLARALHRVYDLDHDLDLIFDLVFDRAPNRDFVLDLGFVLARDVWRDVTRARARALDLVLVRGLDLVRARAHDLVRALNLVLERAFALVRDLDRARTSALDPLLDIVIPRGLDRALDEVLGTLLGLEDAAGFGSALLEGLLDDFTGADLSTVDLAGVDLVGVRWSLRGTRWPAAMDVEQLQNRSRETAPGSEVYVVGRGVGTVEPSRV